MNVQKTVLPEVLLVEPRVFTDERGYFFEAFHQARYLEAGIDRAFVQQNQSHSRQGVVRGMHYQLSQPQAKLVRVLAGAVFDVAVDVRRGSPRFGRWVGVELSGDNKRQLFIPEGFAHGFVALSEWADLEYLCSSLYAPADERSIRWNDPQVGISWPGTGHTLSSRDAQAPLLRDQADLPAYSGALRQI